MTSNLPIDVLPLFPILDAKLLELLRSLTPEEWQAQTVAKLWRVKDVAAHLLDGNLRGLSTSRDGYFGDPPEGIGSYQGLIDYLNNLNLSWTSATKRLSPQVLTELLATTGPEYTEHLSSLAPDANAVFSVAWAGQEVSPNWFHIAREYTEKFLHQQQIRDAVSKQELMTKELFYPFIDTLMHALPHTFKDVTAENGTVVSLIITTSIGGQWNIVREGSQRLLNKDTTIYSNTLVEIDPQTAWKLFSKSWRPDDVQHLIKIAGNEQLGQKVLEMVAVMA